MASLYSTSASGSGRGSRDSSSDAQQTLSATLSTPSMPDIFVWAPEDGGSVRNSNPKCAFDSADPYFDFGLQQEPPPQTQSPDQHEENETMIQDIDSDDDCESIYQDIEEDFVHTQVAPRKSGFEDTQEPIVFTREAIFQQPPPPPVPEKPKNLRNRAASFIKSLGRQSKKTSVVYSPELQQSRRAASQDRPSSDRDTIRSKRSILFNLTRKNKSTTALHRVSTTESDLSLDPDPFSSTPPVPPVPPVPIEYESQVRRPVLRRQGTEPSSLRNRAIQQASPPLPPLPSINTPPFKPFSHSSPPTVDYFPSRVPSASHKEKPIPSTPSLVTPPPRGSSHVKLPSLHFESLEIDLGSF
jgi:hypothetical protein